VRGDPGAAHGGASGGHGADIAWYLGGRGGTARERAAQSSRQAGESRDGTHGPAGAPGGRTA